MRRGILLSIGVLEASLACVLIVVGWQLPQSESIENSFDRVGRLSVNAETQVRLMREQIAEIRQRDFPKAASQLRAQTRVFSAKIGDSHSNAPSVHAMNDAVLAYAIGFEDWSATLIDERVASENRRRGPSHDPANEPLTNTAIHACRSMELFAAKLEHECFALHTVLGEPIDASVIIRGIGKIVQINDLLQRINDFAVDRRFDSLRDASAELEFTLEAAYRHVEVASSASIPLLIPNGTQQPFVQMVPLWPEGKQTARALRGTLTAVKKVNGQIDSFAQFAESMRDSRLKTQALFEATQRIRSIAAGVRQSLNGLQRTLKVWPTLAQAAHSMSGVLRESRRQVDDGTVPQRSEYERAVHGSRQATESAEDLLRSYSTRLNARLSEQERSLAHMERGLGEVTESIPLVSSTTSGLLSAIRWMFWLVGGLLALHGAYVICESRYRVRNESEPAAQARE